MRSKRTREDGFENQTGTKMVKIRELWEELKLTHKVFVPDLPI